MNAQNGDAPGPVIGPKDSLAAEGWVKAEGGVVASQMTTDTDTPNRIRRA